MQALREENAALKARPLADLELLHAELDASRDSFVAAQEQHEAACAVLNRRLEEARGSAAALQRQLADVSGERDFFMAQRSESSSQITELTQERDALTASLEEASGQLDSLKEVSFMTWLDKVLSSLYAHIIDCSCGDSADIIPKDVHDVAC